MYQIVLSIKFSPTTPSHITSFFIPDFVRQIALPTSRAKETMKIIPLCFRIADRSAARSDDGLAERILASFAAAQLVPGRSAQHPHAPDEPQG